MADDMTGQWEVLVQSNIVLATAHLTQTCIAYDKSPDDVAAIYTRMYDLMQDWYTGKPMKEQIKMMLETLLPG